MKLVLENQKISVREQDVLGTGGEATVLRYGDLALKLYHQPDPLRIEKLQALLSLSQAFPAGVVAPRVPLLDEKGRQIIGFAMEALPGEFELFCRLFQRAYRDSCNLNQLQVSGLLLEMHHMLQKLHALGLVVGDLNDANAMFYQGQLRFIDVDSYQYRHYPCPVATQDYLDPALYNVDLTAAPRFKPENDWYSFGVLAFRALLLAHPYGGTHPTLKHLAARAQARVTVLDSGVKYPRTALNPKLLSDDLLHLFHRIFAEGWRGNFPKQVLRDYAGLLTECRSCGQWYPCNRISCPACSATAAFVMPEMVTVAGLRCEEFLKVDGALVYYRLLGDTFYCIALEGGNTVLYSAGLGMKPRRRVLFSAIPGAQYAIGQDFLVVCPLPSSPDLLLLDLSGDTPKGVAKLTTDLYGGNRAAFGCSSRYLYRIAGGMLMQGELKWGQILERPVCAVLENQTWFEVASATSPGRETLLGCTRVFNRYDYFAISRGQRFDLEVQPLLQGESLLEQRAFFSGDELLLVRRARLNGEEWLRFETFEAGGKKQWQRYCRASDLQGLQNLGGLVYSRGVALIPTDAGIVKADLATGQNQTLSATQPYAGDGDGLEPFGRGLLAINQNKIYYIEVTK